MKSYRERHAELLRENERLVAEIKRQKEYTMGYIGELEKSRVLYLEACSEIVDSDHVIKELGKQIDVLRMDLFDEEVDHAHTEYALDRSRMLAKRLEWFIRGNPPERSQVSERTYNEIIALINEQTKS